LYNKGLQYTLLVLVFSFYAGIFSIVVCNFPFRESFASVDFYAYYAGAYLLQEQRDIYSTAQTRFLLNELNLQYIEGSDYIYPPYLAAVLGPFTKFISAHTLAGIWFILNGLFLIVAINALLDYINCTQSDRFRWTLIGSALFVPTLYAFWVGQVNLLILVCVSLAVTSAERKHWFISSVLLTTTILVKVAPIVFLLYFAVTRQYRIIFFTCFLCALVVILTLPIYRDYLTSYINEVLPALAESQPHPVNQSFNGFFSRLFTSSVFTIPLINTPNLVYPMTMFASIVLVSVNSMMAWKIWHISHGADLLLSSLMITSVVISPLAWENLYVLLLLPYIVISRYTLTRLQFGMLILSIGLIFAQRLWNPFVNAPTAYPQLQNLGLLMSAGLFGAIILLILIIMLFIQTTRREKGNSGTNDTANGFHQS
jgi:Glycosyltransferase family 87